MKVFILKNLMFCLFALLFYVFIVFLFGKFIPSQFKPNINYRIGSYGHMNSRIKEINDMNETKILFLGSSHAYRGFDTRIFKSKGISSFNLGSSSQTPLQTMVLLKRYLQKIKPEMVIYEVYPEIFSMDGVESSLDIIANDRNDVYSIRMAIEVNNMKVYNTLIYGMSRDLFNMNSTFSEPAVKGNDTYIPGGYVERKIEYFNPSEFEKHKFEFLEYQLDEFRNIVEYLKSMGIKVILVYAPVSPSLYKSYLDKSEFDKLMDSFSEYYNFNVICKMNDTLHFYDPHHMNQNGVEIFNEKLIEILKSDNHID